MYPQQPQQQQIALVDPARPPFVVPIRVHPNLQNLLPYFTGIAINTVLSQATRNPWRNYLYTCMAQNNWQNEEFQGYVSALGELVELWVFTRNMTPDQALNDGAAELAGCLTAIKALQNLQMFQGQVDQAAVQEMQHMAGIFQGRKQEILQYRQWQQQQQYQQQRQAGHNQGYPQQGVPYNPTSGNYRPVPMGVQGNSMNAAFGGQQMARPMGDSMGGSLGIGTRVTSQEPAPYQQVTPTTGFPMQPAPGMSAVTPPAPVAAPQPEPWQINTPAPTAGPVVEELTFEPRRPVKLPPPLPGARAVQETPVAQPITPTPASAPQPDSDWVSLRHDSEFPKVRDPLRPLDAMLTAEGVEIRPAFKSGWTRTWSPEKPYGIIYNPKTHMLFHARIRNGRVVELLNKLADDMDYLKNELDESLRKQVEEKSAVPKPPVAVDWSLVRALKPLPGQPVAVAVEVEEGSGDAVEDVEVGLVEETIKATTLADAHSKAKAARKALGIAPEKAMEYYVDQVKLVETGTPRLGVLHGLAASLSLDEVHDKLLAAKSFLSEELWKVADERITTGVNQALSKNLSLSDWSIDSFAEDYNDLKDLLNKSFGEAQDSVCNTLMGYGPEIAGAWLAVMDAESTEAYLRKYLNLPEDAAVEANYVIFIQRTSVTEVPWAEADMDVVVGQGGVLTADATPHLYELVKSIFLRTTDYPETFAHRYLLTADGKYLDLRKGYLVADAYLLFPTA